MNIKNVVKNKLCIQCGICAAACPLRCIALKRNQDDFLPVVNQKKCTDCGLCARVCSVSELSNYDASVPLEDFIMGDYISVHRAQTKDGPILQNSTSGGITTTLIKSLLQDNLYDCAFVIDGYSYSEQLQTHRMATGDDLSETQKSRYLTVSHCEAMRYIRKHPDQRVILIGTGCIVSSFINTINTFGLNRDNYFLIGLFCDKTMTYGVRRYFAQHRVGRGRILKNLYFRTKQAGGWPGGVKLEYTDGTYELLDRTERMKLKEYFVPEKCLYCLNKLNRGADISVGDNYIANNEDVSGVSSVIIRSKIGQAIWERYQEQFVFASDDIEKLKQSQWLKLKQKNLAFAGIKGLLNTTVTKQDKQAYRHALRKIKIGQKSDVYDAINYDLQHHKMISRLLKWLFSINSKYKDGKKNKVITIVGLRFSISK